MGWVSFLIYNAIQLCLDKWDGFPSGRLVSKVYRKTQLSYYPNCYWSKWMIFHLCKDFLNMSGLPASQPSPSQWGCSPRRRGNYFCSRFWSLDLWGGFLSVCAESCLWGECTLWSPICVCSEGRGWVSPPWQSSQLVLQSLTRNLLINGAFLI